MTISNMSPSVVKALPLVVLLLVAAGRTVAEMKYKKGYVHHGESQIEWLRKNGGYVHPQLEIRHYDVDDKTSPYGMFSKGPIAEGALMLEIPQHCLLRGGPVKVGDRIGNFFDGEWYPGYVTAINYPDDYDPENEDEDDDSEITYDLKYDDGAVDEEVTWDEFETDGLDCGTIRTLAKELMKGDDSYWSAYVNYLNDIAPGELPGSWSDEGKELLESLVGYDQHKSKQLPPTSLTEGAEVDLGGRCMGDLDDPFETHAFWIAYQRGWDEILIPVYDMMSHRNGRFLNTVNNPVRKGNVRVRAARYIEPGEQIYTSYNFCDDCQDRLKNYGTPEILRDYGFVEQMPQRWIFPQHDIGFDLDYVYLSETGLEHTEELVVTWMEHAPTPDGIIWMQDQIKRLKRFGETVLEDSEETADIPEFELDVIRKYHEALLVAFQEAIKAIPENNFQSSGYSLYEDLEAAAHKVEKLREEWGDERPHTCNDEKTYNLDRWVVLETIESKYQAISYSYIPEDDDTCFDLDDTVQICSSYRPHYHEAVVHYTAGFIETVKRVLFVGGGDSMLLHEILQYPTIEKVVGLELDQQVTRSAFKYFGTQPHFDDDKVEWWFGDATKSLQMLPRDYFGSFDMVLVDLSETVMSWPVSGELDVMGALARLVKPDGIIVKNEFMYFPELLAVSQNTLHIHYYDVPIVCSQSLMLASNEIDVLRGQRYDHAGVKTRLTWLDDDSDDDKKIIHDYQKNLTSVRTNCRPADTPEKVPTVQESSPGILMIIEAEEASRDVLASNAEALAETIKVALTNLGLSVMQTAVFELDGSKKTVVIVLKEGYVVARAWPDNLYCAFDVHLWSNFDSHPSMQRALVEAVGSQVDGPSSSTYRIVAGGMYGVPTWKEDEKNRGPDFMEVCKCPADSPQCVVDSSRNEAVEPSSVHAAVQKMMEVMLSEQKDESDALVAVMCGYAGEPCESLSPLEKMAGIKVFPLYACEGLKKSETILQDFDQCETDTLKVMRSMVEESFFRVVVVDPSLNSKMAQVILSILRSPFSIGSYIDDYLLVLNPIIDEKDAWRRVFTHRVRDAVYKEDPVFTSEILFNSTATSFELSIASAGDEYFGDNLLSAIQSVEKNTGLVADVRSIRGGTLYMQEDFTPSQWFLPKDYDNTDAAAQWVSQKPLGMQTVIQFEVNEKDEDYDKSNPYVPLTVSEVKEVFVRALAAKGEDTDKLKLHEAKEMGDGSVVIALWPGGNAVLLWDGRKHIDINLFTHKEDSIFAKSIELKFKSEWSESAPMEVKLRDQQPRGTGRVINFLVDIPAHDDLPPYWENPMAWVDSMDESDVRNGPVYKTRVQISRN